MPASLRDLSPTPPPPPQRKTTLPNELHSFLLGIPKKHDVHIDISQITSTLSKIVQIEPESFNQTYLVRVTAFVIMLMINTDLL